MKKLALILPLIIASFGCVSQSWHPKGVWIGDSTISGSNIILIDSIVLSATDTAIYSGGYRIALGLSVPTGGAGVSNFLNLTDSPNNYTDDGYKLVRVNVGETALEFSDTLDAYVNEADTAVMLTPYVLLSELTTWLDNLIPGLSNVDSLVEGGGIMRFYYPDRYYDVFAPTAPDDTTKWFFADNGGDDGNDGHRIDDAKQTLGELESLTLDPGDSVFFNKGDTWRAIHHADGGAETPGIELSTRGAVDNHIVFTSYGSGDDPKIYGSDAPASWTDNGADVWYATGLYDMSTYGSIWFVDTDESIHWGNEEASIVAVDAAYDFYFSGTTLYVYSTSDPVSAFNSVEVPQIAYLWEFLVRYDSAEYNTIDGIEFAYAAKNGVHMEYPGGIDGESRSIYGLEVRNCEIHHIGTKDGYGYGIWSTYSDAIFEDNEIHNMGRRGISLSANGDETQDSMRNVHIRDNYFHTGWHTTGPDIINDGNGLIMDSVNIYRNIIEDSKTISVVGGLTSNGIYIELDAGGFTGVKLINSYIYNNLFKYSKGKGIQLITNFNADNLFDSILIHNNVFYDFNDNVVDYGLIHIDSISGTFEDVLIRNNITYSSNSSNYNVLMYYSTGVGITMDYNLHYATHGSSCFNEDGNNYTLAQWANWKTATGWESNSPTPADPVFKTPPDNLRVHSGSPAAGAGVTIAEYTHDYEEVAVSDPPNIGAIETTED